MGRLDNKVAIITGAGSGIGQVEALMFAKEGASVVIADINSEAGKETAEMVEGIGGKAVSIDTDVSKSEDIRRLIRNAIDEYGKLDILVNGAAIVGDEVSTIDCPEEVFARVISINLQGVWQVMKYSIPEMIRTGGGSVINITSIAGILAFKGIPAYAAAKGGVISLSKVAAYEYASDNVRVNCIAPGTIATPMLLNHWSEDMLNRIRCGTPQGRLGEPEEVARAALFLASDESTHITGHTLIIDGGSTARMPF